MQVGPQDKIIFIGTRVGRYHFIFLNDINVQKMNYNK